MTNNTERDALADVLMSDAVMRAPGMGRDYALVEADVVLAWMRENGYEKREAVVGSCWDRSPEIRGPAGACGPERMLCELPAGHAGAHRSGTSEWMVHRPEPVVVDDAMVLRFLNAQNPRAATNYIGDWGAETVDATRAALTAALTPDGQEGTHG